MNNKHVSTSVDGFNRKSLQWTAILLFTLVLDMPFNYLSTPSWGFRVDVLQGWVRFNSVSHNLSFDVVLSFLSQWRFYYVHTSRTSFYCKICRKLHIFHNQIVHLSTEEIRIVYSRELSKTILRGIFVLFKRVKRNRSGKCGIHGFSSISVPTYPTYQDST